MYIVHDISKPIVNIEKNSLKKVFIEGISVMQNAQKTHRKKPKKNQTKNQRHKRNERTITYGYHICRNKRPGRLIFGSNKKTFQNPSVLCTPPFENHPSKATGFVYSPLGKITHQNPPVLCTPPLEESHITTHRFCVLPPWKNHTSQPIGFVYSPLWKITVFGGRFCRGGRLFRQIRICINVCWTNFVFKKMIMDVQKEILCKNDNNGEKESKWKSVSRRK